MLQPLVAGSPSATSATAENVLFIVAV